jgi:hypothetical protein
LCMSNTGDIGSAVGLHISHHKCYLLSHEFPESSIPMKLNWA